MAAIESLKHCLMDDPKCMGVAWECRKGSGLYNYQNDNDLGLDAEDIEGVFIEAERIPLDDRGHYMLLDLGDCQDMEDGAAADLGTVKALLKECHPPLFQLSEAEKKLCEAYWARF